MVRTLFSGEKVITPARRSIYGKVTVVTDRAYQVPPEKRLPRFGTYLAAAMDLVLPDDLTISPHAVMRAPLGVKFRFSDGYHGVLYGRSHILFKYRLLIPIDIIDGDYTGEISVQFVSLSDEEIFLEAGLRVCQLEVVSDGGTVSGAIESDLRRTGGFGSTGA